MRNSGTLIAYKSGMKKSLAVIVLALSVMLLGVVLAAARPTHMNKFKNPEGCGVCHRGQWTLGMSRPKLSSEAICFRCHRTFGSGRRATDIETVFTKASRHPVIETSIYHMRGEALPETDTSAQRHVSCADCHVAHVSAPGAPLRGARGYIPGLARARLVGLPPTGLRLGRASEEYELCYLCHSDSANLPPDSSNMGELFNPGNESYHPVETPGRSANVPSLVRALSVSSRIKCSDCHGNNDPSPRGPHGSDYAPILVAEYRTDDGPEDPRRYELCYMCHDRRSILGDESFIRHNLHVVQQATSCFTCHGSHGSRDNPRLIEFNTLVVEPSPTSGGPDYVPGVAGSPRCYLSCHGIDHNFNDVGGLPWP